MNKAVLKDIGLTEYETELYLALITHGQVSAYELTEKELVGTRLIMSDHFSFWSGSDVSGWWYNHGRFGTAMPWPGVQYDDPPGRPDIIGENQLFGDGAVKWKTAGEFDLAGMEHFPTYPDGWVSQGTGLNSPNGYFY